MITIKQLTYALALEKTLHFRKAAEACSVSQSAFSTALSEMEKQLGFQVFERDNKKVLVTPLGKQMLNAAREIKLKLDDLHHLADQGKQPLNSSMSIGIIPTISCFLLPMILPSLQQQYPNLRLSIFEEQSQVLVDKVRDGEIDAAILALPFDTQGLLQFKFWEENFFWICHRDNPLSRSSSIQASEINSSELMLLSEGHCLKDHALSVCQLHQVQNHTVSATSLNTLIHLVNHNIGSTLIPEMALKALIENNPNVMTIPLLEKGPHREIAFIVRPNYPLLNAIELLIELFVSLLQGEK